MPGNKPTSVASSKQKVIDQLQHLVDLNGDVDRNILDSWLAGNGNRIRYVFDYDVFDLLQRPAKPRHCEAASIFCKIPWGSNDDGSAWKDEQRLWHAINRQSSVVTAEHLFSGELPGQRGGEIYMTEWHFFELDKRRTENLKELKPSELTTPKNRATDETLEKLKALDSKDFRRLPPEVIQKFMGTRELAYSVSGDDFRTTAYEINRIFRGDISGRLEPLANITEFDEAQIQKLQQAASFWEDEIDRMLSLRRARGYEGDMRSRGAIKNDALSLAHVLLGAERCAERGEYLVFVTGDDVLFDTYRWWYVNEAQDKPFVLRRVRQYSPLLNLHESDSDVTGHRDLFDRSRRAVKAALFAFNMDSGSLKDEGALAQNSSGNNNNINVPQEYIAYRLKYRAKGQDPILGFFQKQLDSWISKYSSELDRIGETWKTAERFAICVNHRHLEGRRVALHAAHRTIELYYPGPYIESALQYIEDLLDDVASGTIRVFFPFAVEYLKAQYRQVTGGVRSDRVPLAVTVRIPTPRGSSESKTLDEVFEARGSQQNNYSIDDILDVNANPAISESHDTVFGLAAAVALRKGAWREAERFADLATSVGRHHGVDKLSVEAKTGFYEFVYLSAMAKRFRLGNEFLGRDLNRAKNLVDSAKTAIDRLTECERFHAEQGQSVREMRAISERAALRLFYVACATILSRTAQSSHLRKLYEDAGSALNAAFSDLRKCGGLESAAREVAVRRGQLVELIDQIRNQYLSNMAGAEVLSHIRASTQPDKEVSVNFDIHELEKQLTAWEKEQQFASQHAVSHIDVYAFRVLHYSYLKHPEGSRQLEDLETEIHKLAKATWSLPLDREFARMVSSHILARRNPAR
jgi:hypothetical protein